jgi:hypothetical protein
MWKDVPSSKPGFRVASEGWITLLGHVLFEPPLALKRGDTVETWQEGDMAHIVVWRDGVEIDSRSAPFTVKSPPCD